MRFLRNVTAKIKIRLKKPLKFVKNLFAAQCLTDYQKLKEKNIEVIAFALDSDSKSYKETIASLPWINDTELKGWQSSYTETYNVRATPTYFVLDKNNKIIEKPTNFSAFLSTLE